MCGVGDTAVAGHGGQGKQGPNRDVRRGFDLHIPVVDGQLKVVDQQNAQNDLTHGQVRLGQICVELWK